MSIMVGDIVKRCHLDKTPYGPALVVNEIKDVVSRYDCEIIPKCRAVLSDGTEESLWCLVIVAFPAMDDDGGNK